MPTAGAKAKALARRAAWWVWPVRDAPASCVWPMRVASAGCFVSASGRMREIRHTAPIVVQAACALEGCGWRNDRWLLMACFNLFDPANMPEHIGRRSRPCRNSFRNRLSASLRWERKKGGLSSTGKPLASNCLDGKFLGVRGQDRRWIKRLWFCCGTVRCEGCDRGLVR